MNVPQRIMNTTIVLNFIRSANAPQIRAGVMMKNMHWNSMKLAVGNASCPEKVLHHGGHGVFSSHVGVTWFMNR